MALEAIKSINHEIKQYGQSVKGVMDAAKLLDRKDVDEKIKEIIAPKLINLFALRLPELENENKLLRRTIQNFINEREIRSLTDFKSKRYLELGLNISVRVVQGAFASTCFMLMTGPIGGCLMVTFSCHQATDKADQLNNERDLFDKIEALIRTQNLSFEEAKKKIGY